MAGVRRPKIFSPTCRIPSPNQAGFTILSLKSVINNPYTVIKNDVSDRERESYEDSQPVFDASGGFRPAVPEIGNAWNDRLSRRKFLKRTGGATAATLLAVHATKVEVLASVSTKQIRVSYDEDDTGWTVISGSIKTFPRAWVPTTTLPTYAVTFGGGTNDISVGINSQRTEVTVRTSLSVKLGTSMIRTQVSSAPVHLTSQGFLTLGVAGHADTDCTKKAQIGSEAVMCGFRWEWDIQAAESFYLDLYLAGATGDSTAPASVTGQGDPGSGSVLTPTGLETTQFPVLKLKFEVV